MDSCSGPSPFKALSQHLNQDNSRHQDRANNANGAGPANGFRAQDARAAEGQAAHDAFMAQAPQLGGEHPGALLEGFAENPQGFRPHAAQAVMPIHPDHQSYNRAPMPPASNVGGNWANEFAAMNSARAHHAQPAGEAAQLAMNQPMAHHPAGLLPAFQPRFMPMAGASAMMHSPQQAMSQAPASDANQSYAFAPLYDAANRTTDPQNGARIRNQADDDFQREMDMWMSANSTNGFTSADLVGVDEELAAVAREYGATEADTAEFIEDTHTIMTDIANEMDAMHAGAEAAAHQREADLTDLRDQLNLESPLENLTMTDLVRDEVDALPQANQAPVAEASDQSEIAQAAERLLESVAHEQGSKWGESRFLALMRDLRDGKKTVDGNDIKGADHSGPDDAPAKDLPGAWPSGDDSGASGAAGAA